MSNTIPLPEEPDGFQYLIDGVWRHEIYFNGVKAKEVRRLYAADQMHAHAAAVSAAKDAEIAQLRQYLDTAQRRAGALGDEVAGLREALESISNIADRRAVYEMARTALAARKGEA